MNKNWAICLFFKYSSSALKTGWSWLADVQNDKQEV